MRGATVFSGIGAPEVAMPWVDWQWCAEIEAFPAAVYRERFPAVLNLGDVLASDFLERAAAMGPIDILVGGPPCQDFSIAGLRAGLAGARGNLSMRWMEIIDAVRPLWAITENVPGWLSDKDNAFGAFLAGLVGADAPLVPGRGQRWTDAGLVAGPRRTAAWRTLDAQFFGLAQRRERVFVVAGPRDGPHPGEILFEPEGVRGNPAPRREAREAVARPVAGGSPGSGGWRGDADTADSLVAHTVRPTSKDAAWRVDGADNLIASGEIVGSLTASTWPRGHGGSGLATNGGAEAGHLLAFGGNDRRGPIDIASALNGHGGPHGRQDFSVETFIAEPQVDGNANAGGQVAIAFDTTQITSPVDRSNPQPGGLCHTLAPSAHPPAIAFENRSRGDDGRGYDRPPNFMVDISPTVNSTKQPAVATTMVRRLTPEECEKLQGFPPGWTLVAFRRGKPAKDGPRYRAIGNSMATPVMSWIGRRIQESLS